MAHPVVQEAIESSTNTAGTSHVVTLPTATAGQLLLIILDKGSTSATINAHGSLTELLDEASANGLYIAYRWMDGTEPASYTLTSSANTRSARIAYRISGAMNPAVDPPQIGTTSSGSSATPDPPASATPGSSKDYLFIAFYGAAGEEADDDTWSDTPPTNYTPSPPRTKSCGTAGTNLGGLIAAAERALTTGSAENPGTFAKDVSAAWRAQTIMIHPSNPQSVTPTNASLSISTFAPTVTVTNNQLVTPEPASLTLSTNAPSVVVNNRVFPSNATLTLTTFAPTVTASEGDAVLVTPGAASLTLTTFAPTVTASAHQLVTPTNASLSLTTFAPTVTASDHKLVVPTPASLSLTGFAPSVVATDPKLVIPGFASLSLATFIPTITVAPVVVNDRRPGGMAASQSVRRLMRRRSR